MSLVVLAMLAGLGGSANAFSPSSTEATEVRRTPPPAPATDNNYVAFHRRGLVARGSVGFTLCAQEFCNALPVGGLGRVDLGYRLGLFSLIATFGGGGGRVDVPDFETDDGPVTGVRGGLTTMFAGAGALLHPLRLGRVDPWVGATFGFSRMMQRVDSDQGPSQTKFSRGGVELGTGIDVYVSPRVALGPRFDAVLPFGGTVCTKDDRPEVCSNIVDVVAADTAAGRRSRRRALPRPWSVTFGATFYLR